MKYAKLIDQAKLNVEETKSFLESIKDRSDLDDLFAFNHEKVFQEIDCLDCANCCKNHSPIILQEDMDRISDYLNISTGEFIQTYLEMDEEGDFVYQKQPCPFLQSDNKCKIYEVRPLACAEYPHTNHKGMNKLNDLTLNNTQVCPAAFKIVKRMSETLNA